MDVNAHPGTCYKQPRGDGNMCLSTVSIDSKGKLIKIMTDVACIEAKDDGFVLTGLFGDEKFVQGKLKSMDFVDGQSILLEP